MSVEIYEVGHVRRKRYWREASIVMDCLNFQAHEPETGHRFEATWKRHWFSYVLTIRELFPRDR